MCLLLQVVNQKLSHAGDPMGLVLFCSEDEGQHASPQPDQGTAQAVAVLGPKPDLLEQRACCTFLVGADDLWGLQLPQWTTTSPLALQQSSAQSHRKIGPHE